MLAKVSLFFLAAAGAANAAAVDLERRQSWLIGTQTGEATYYNTGLGACGINNSDSEHVVALSKDLFDNYPGWIGTNPNNNPVCGKRIQANYHGRSVVVTVVDRCYGCKVTDIDLSPAAFAVLEDLGVGRLRDVTWNWL